jgi:hypothetical protein
LDLLDWLGFFLTCASLVQMITVGCLDSDIDFVPSKLSEIIFILGREELLQLASGLCLRVTAFTGNFFCLIRVLLPFLLL